MQTNKRHRQRQQKGWNQSNDDFDQTTMDIVNDICFHNV